MVVTPIITITPDQYQTILNNYALIVEKTNQQLNMWSNPYGLMVVILTLMVALGAIIVAIYIWKNSADQKQRQKDFFDGQEKLIKERYEREDSLTEERNKKAKEEFDALIKEQQTKLATTDASNKEKVQQAIDALKGQRANVGTYLEPVGLVPSLSAFQSLNLKSMICTKCGKFFTYYDDSQNPFSTSYTISLRLNSNNQVHCPYCSAINIPQ